jgi:plasmid stability protein
MAQILVRNIDSDVKAKLRARAKRHGRSTEAEVREILRSAVKGEGAPVRPLGTRIKARFARIGLDEDIHELRGNPARPADLGS